MQALAEGDLTERARKRALEIANDADLRVHPTKASLVRPAVALGRDPRLPAAGAVLRRRYRGRMVEVQVLDHGYTEQYEKQSKKKADWFTTNGDVFPTGSTSMKPFAPVSPDGRRSFPSKNLSKGVGEWNHYYVRCINGEIRLWVNGEEVSGGNGCEPRAGYLCTESEGSPVEFKHIRIRELP